MKTTFRRIMPAAVLAALVFFSACTHIPDRDFREDMRQFVISISDYAKAGNSGFIIIPQNGQELITLDGEHSGTVHSAYAAAIDGSGREDLYYGYDRDNAATPTADFNWMNGFLQIMEAEGVEVLVTDYVWGDSAKINDSYSSNAVQGYISFTPPSRELDGLPSYPAAPYNNHSNAVADLSQARNFLYLLNPENMGGAAAYISTLDATNYDAFIIDAYHADGSMLTSAQISQLQSKPGGGRRLVIAYMSIGEAEDYREYWLSSWSSDRPDWLLRENPNWPGNYLVAYWEPAWQDIIFGSGNAYLDKILAAGFDGVYLDIIDAFERFE